MVISHFLTHGLFFGIIVTGYLLILMLTVSPRVWGYADYSDEIKRKVLPQTKREKMLAAIVGLPWLLFVLGFPILSTCTLKVKLGNEIPFWLAFLNIFVLTLLATLGDAVLLDWLIVSRITPSWVIIPGTAAADYRDFAHHFRAHVKAAIPQIAVWLVVSGIVSFL